MTRPLDETGIAAAEIELSHVLADYDYVMPVDGMQRVVRAYLSALGERAEPKVKALREALRKEADAAYCRFLDKMSSRECLGEEAKLQSGKFGVAELNAHREARELLGIHRGIYKALKAFDAALTAQADVGWRLVPVEPTFEMMQAMYEAMFADKWDGTQAPMIGAGYDAALASLPAKAMISRMRWTPPATSASPAQPCQQMEVAVGDLAGLIERLKALSGPDREVDARLWCGHAHSGRRLRGISDSSVFYEDAIDGLWIRNNTPLRRVPAYTASLDAAVALVERKLPGWTFMLDNRGMGDRNARAKLLKPGYISTADEPSYAASPAIALLLALLSSLSSGDRE